VKNLDAIGMILALAVGVACGALAGAMVERRIVVAAAERAGCEVSR
jgi:uncharacterized protein YebE (UPF0316 family)